MRAFHCCTLALGAALLSVPAIVSCVGDDPTVLPETPGDGGGGTNDSGGGGNDGGGGGADADAASGATFTLNPPRPRVPRGGTLDVQVALERKGVTGDVAIVITGLPSGVTATAATVPAGANTATVTLTATATAAMGVAPIVVTGASATDLETDVVVAGTPGQSDESFEGDGFNIDTSVATATFQAVVEQPDGKVVVAGATNTAGGTWIVKRFNADGTVDTAFNTAAAPAMPTTGVARGLALDPVNGKIIVVGGSGANEQLTIVRLAASGSVDQGFANAGTMIANGVTHSQGSRGNGVVVLSDSSIVIAGRHGTLGLVEAFTAGGLPHATFNRFETNVNADLYGIGVLTNGSLIVTGTDTAASPDAQLAFRLSTTGAPDTAFGGATGRSYASGCRGNGFALTPKGDAVIVGDDQTAPVLCATRIAASGTGDAAWTKKSSAGASGAFFAATAAFQNDATYSLGHGGGSQDRFAVVERRLVDGGLDPAFDTDGVVKLEDVVGVPDTFRYVIRASAPGRDGRVIFAGSRTGTVSPGAFVARMWE